jgi:23S rRNA (adenine2030-N6)-methyltransferase
MNYRHAFHAGNFADVLKHLILTRVLEHLKKKPAPFRVIDTHAGTGLYDLHADEASRTGEWRDGIGRLLKASIPDGLVPVFEPYLKVLEDINVANAAAMQGGGEVVEDGGQGIKFYPGSPLIAALLKRREDVVVANELHAADKPALAQALKPYSNCKVMGLDGYVALKSTLPPKERRGVILIDPPFEQPGEFQRLHQALRQGVQRFATGTYLLWYPIKDPRPVVAFKKELAALGLAKLMAVEFFVRAPDDPDKLNGHGLVMLNPPFSLKDELGACLPFLVELLAQGEGGTFRIDEIGGI